MSSNSDTSSSVVTSSKQMGRVKWFNNKDGYGFITSTQTNTDIFAHHSAISVVDQYKYLVQGEYVEFELVNTQNNPNHKVQASNICGINSGKLMCETRNDFKTAKNNYKGIEQSQPVQRTSSSTVQRNSSSSRQESQPVQRKSSSRQESQQVQRTAPRQSQRNDSRGGGPRCVSSQSIPLGNQN
jgi:CspA family cold shock protein